MAKGRDGVKKTNAGVMQKWTTVEGREIVVEYYAFTSPEEALEHIGSYPLFKSVNFQEGPYSGRRLGDISWASTQEEVTALAAVKGHIVVVVKAGADMRGNEEQTEGMARRIVVKIRTDQ
jgi:hypothetical protein